MQALKEFQDLAEYNSMTELSKSLDIQLTAINEAVSAISTGVGTDLEAALDEATKRLMAAKRGLGLANKLKDREANAKNRSRIMGNLNQIRSILRQVERKLSEPTNNIHPELIKAAKEQDFAGQHMLQQPKPNFIDRLKKINPFSK